MALILSYISALQFWCLRYILRDDFRAVPRAKRLIAKPLRLEHVMLDAHWDIDRPLHVLTSDASTRRPSKHIIYHTWTGPLPHGSILDIGQGFSVCSPELCFIQMATMLDLIHLIELGFELCGSYTSSREDPYQKPPVTTVAKIRSLIAKLPGVHGTRKASRALQFIVDNAASPMEAILVMLLCLPYRYGGYGLPLPVLNQRIEVKAPERNQASDKVFFCDLFWPEAKHAVEYDSNLFHAKSAQLTRDSVRRKNLSLAGITVTTATSYQVQNISETDDLARLLSKVLKKRLYYTEPAFSQARSSLRKALLTQKNEYR